MNNIDDILQDLNMEIPSENSNNTPQDSSTTEETNISPAHEPTYFLF